MKRNECSLPVLDSSMMDLIISHIFGGLDDIEEQETRDFISLLQAVCNYNYQYRKNEICKIYPIMEEVIGPFNSNSEGPLFYCSMGLAIKELYGMRNSTLQSVLEQATRAKLW